jgi:LCP family protein required for cell wall assembly
MSHPQARRGTPASGSVATARSGGAVYGAQRDSYGGPVASSGRGDAGDDWLSETTRRRRAAQAPGAATPGRPGQSFADDDFEVLSFDEPRQSGRARSGGSAGRPRSGERPPRGGGDGPGRGGRGGRGSGSGGAPKKKAKRRDPLWARLLVIGGAMLMVLSGGLIVGGKALVAQVTGDVEKAPLLGEAGVSNAKALTGPLNILMVGIDERPANSTDLVRADSILILHIPATHDRAYLASIPRDSYVKIPAFTKTKYNGGNDKINSAFAFGWQNGGGRQGGFELLSLTISRMTGLKFNAGAIVDFKGFEKVVDALGGVDLCVDSSKPVKSEHWGFDSKGKYLSPHEGGKPMTYYPGECRQFGGWEALDYVRQRKSLEDGDYGRQRHQQQFVKALAKRAKDRELQKSPLKLLELVKSIGSALTVDLNGASIESWLYTVKGVGDNDVVLLKSNGGKFNPIRCGGEECEGLTQETLDMFAALKADSVDDFVLAHPDFVSK